MARKRLSQNGYGHVADFWKWTISLQEVFHVMLRMVNLGMFSLQAFVTLVSCADCSLQVAGAECC